MCGSFALFAVEIPSSCLFKRPHVALRRYRRAKLSLPSVCQSASIMKMKALVGERFVAIEGKVIRQLGHICQNW